MWSSHVGKHDDVSPSVWEQVQAENPTRQEVNNLDSSPEPLNPEQRKLYDICVRQYEQELDPDQPTSRQLL
jgi:hypothetical protein